MRLGIKTPKTRVVYFEKLDTLNQNSALTRDVKII